MTTPAIIIHFFTYRGDQEIIKEAFLCAKQALPEARFVMIDDAHSPCSPEVRDEMLELGVQWRESDWPRGGNLRGKPCITGILGEMLDSSTHPDDVLVKIDADTCLMDGDDIRAFARDTSKILCAAGERDVRIFGCCYCIRAQAMRTILSYVAQLDLPAIAPEDVVIGFAACALFKDESSMILYKTDAKGSKWTAYYWWHYPDTVKYRGATMITVGNPPPAPLSKKQRLPIMQKLRLEAKSYLQAKEKKGATVSTPAPSN